MCYAAGKLPDRLQAVRSAHTLFGVQATFGLGVQQRESVLFCARWSIGNP